MKKLIISTCLIFFIQVGYTQTVNSDSLMNIALVNRDTALAVTHLINKICQKTDISQIEDMEKFGINNQLFEILLKYGTNKTQLLKGADFMAKLVTNEPADDETARIIHSTYLDTYANLLYKGGRVKLAISTEEKAIRYAPQSQKTELIKILEKMQKGLPTW